MRLGRAFRRVMRLQVDSIQAEIAHTLDPNDHTETEMRKKQLTFQDAAAELEDALEEQDRENGERCRYRPVGVPQSSD